MQSRKGGLALPSRGHFVNVGRREESLSCLLAYMFHYKISLFFFFFLHCREGNYLENLKVNICEYDGVVFEFHFRRVEGITK